MNYTSLPGVLSEKAVKEHLKLFNGYKEMLERTDDALMMDPKPESSALDHQFRHTVWSQSYALSGVMLHDLYFNSLSLKPGKPDGTLLKLIETNYGDVETLYKNMKSVALVYRGWAVLAQNVTDKSIRIIGVDSHEEGSLFGFLPILPIDAWEHAYWMDWGTNKAGYLDALEKYIDWSIVSSRVI